MIVESDLLSTTDGHGVGTSDLSTGQAGLLAEDLVVGREMESIGHANVFDCFPHDGIIIVDFTCDAEPVSGFDEVRDLAGIDVDCEGEVCHFQFRDW